MKYIKDLWKPT